MSVQGQEPGKTGFSLLDRLNSFFYSYAFFLSFVFLQVAQSKHVKNHKTYNTDCSFPDLLASNVGGFLRQGLLLCL